MFNHSKEYHQLGGDLMKAAKSENLDKIVEALEKGADINYKDENSDSPLLQAVRMHALETVRILTNRNAAIPQEIWAEAERRKDPEITALLETTVQNRVNNCKGPNQDLAL